MKIFTLCANRKSIVFTCLILLCGLMMSEVGRGQTTVPYTAIGANAWYCPVGVTSITVECWGGGGAGGGATGNPAAGGGGAGGAYTKAVISVKPGTTYNLFVGAGGTGGNGNGGAGQSSWFSTNTTLLAIGGNGGAAATSNNTSAGGGTGPASGNIGGTTNYYGGNGSNSGISGRGGSGGGSAGTASNGNNATTVAGGTAVAGGGAGVAGNNSSADGTDNSNLGGGGAGGHAGSSTNRNGGNGGAGKVVITYTPSGTFKSAFQSMSIGSATWCPGETRNISVTVKNNGTAPWTDIAGKQDINIGVKWDADADYLVRTDVGNLATGATGTFNFTVTAPTIAGTNHLTFDVVYEGVSWFANNANGVGPGNVVLQSSAIIISTPPSQPSFITIGGGLSSVCASTNTVFSVTPVSGVSYTWNTPAGWSIISGQNTNAVTYLTGPTAGNTTVTVTPSVGVGGCSGPARSILIPVNPLPVGTLTPVETSGAENDGQVCIGNIIKFTATPGFNSYIFKVNGAIVQTGTGNVYSTAPLTLAQSGQLVVTVDVADGNNCGATFSAPQIIVNPLPTATLSADKASVCPGGEVTFTSTGGTNYNFKINGSSAQNGTSDTFTTTDLTAGNSVTVDVTNSSGCVATSSPVSIAIYPVPTGTLSASENSGTANDNQICPGTPVTFKATKGFSNYIFYVNGAAIQNSADSIFSTTALNNGDVVTVDVTNSNGCTASFGPQQFISASAVPTGALTAAESSGIDDDNKICASSNVRFTAPSGNSNYKFYLNGTGTALYDGPLNIFDYSGLSNGDYLTVLVTNSNSCSTTFTSPDITVVAVPTGTLTASSSTVCQGGTVSFTAPSGFNNYNFKINGSTFKNGIDSIFSYSSFAEGNVVTVVVTNSEGCTATLNAVTIHINPLPSGTLSVSESSGTASNDGVICAGAPVTFTATSNPAYANYDFKVNNLTVQYGASNTFTPSLPLLDGDVVTVEVTNGSTGCTKTWNAINITAHELPAVNATTGPSSVCVNRTIALTNSTSGGVWGSSNNSIATVNGSGIVTGVAAGSAYILYTVSNSFGCSKTDSFALAVEPITIVANITGPGAVCAGSTILLSNATPAGVWSSSDNSIATVDAFGNVTGVAAGPVSIVYSVTNASGCVTTATKNITVNPLPVMGLITGIMEVCVGSTTDLDNTTTGGNWVSSDPAIARVTPNTGVVTGITPGIVTISYTKTNNGSGCSATVTTDITVKPLPMPTLSGPDVICPQQTGTYTTEEGKQNYQWIITGDSSYTGGGTGDNSITILWKASGPYSIYVNYTEPATGCQGDTSVTVTSAPVNAPTIFGDKQVCLHNIETYTTQAGNINYVWNATGGTIISGGTLADNFVTIQWFTAGQQLVSVNYTDPATGCSPAAPTVENITVKRLPSGTISGSTSVCQNSASPNISFAAAGAQEPYTFTYTLTINGVLQPAVTTGSATVAVPTSTPGTLVYQLIKVGSNNGCDSTITGQSATIIVNPLPVATIGGTTAVCLGGAAPTITFTGSNGTAPYVFTYTINGGANLTVSSVSGNTATVTAPTGTAGAFTYTLVSVRDGSSTACSQSQSGSAVITVNPLPTAAISGTTSVCINSASPSVTFTGSGGTAPYTFSYTRNGGPVLTAVSNTSGIATVAAPTTASGSFVYSLVSVTDASTSTCSNSVSGSATITVTPASVGGSVTADATVCSGSNSGTLTLSGKTGNVVAWQYSTDGGANWANISNTATTYTYTNITTTTRYRAVVQSGNCVQAFSSPAIITVQPVSGGGSVSAAQTICSGSTLTSNLTVSGITGSVVNWQKSANAAFTSPTNIGGASSTLTVAQAGTLTADTWFRAVVQNNPCTVAYSTPVKITVNAHPTGILSGTTAICSGSSATLTIAATGSGTISGTITGGITFSGTAPTINVPVSPASTTTYSIVSLTDATGCSATISGSAAITVRPLPAAPTITPSTATICQGSVQPFTIGTATASLTATGSNTNSVNIPDNNASGGAGPGGATRTIAISGIPATATVTGMSVTFNIDHNNVGDLRINLKAPNGNVLNLANSVGGSGNDFTNTTISSSGTLPLTTAPFTGTFAADADNNIAGATSGGGNTSNVTSFPGLYSQPNGTWTFSARDVSNGTTGSITNWSITIYYTTASVPQAVTWSPATDLYTDAGATAAYAGTAVSNIYLKPATYGSKPYTATLTDGNGCKSSSTVNVTVNQVPVVKIIADYCAVAGKVQLTASSTPAASSYIWSTGATTQTIVVDIAGSYKVTGYYGSCSGTASVEVAQELVANGDFEEGNTSFTSDYAYKVDVPGLVPAGQGELYNDTGNNAYSVTDDGQKVHVNFWGRDHTTGAGNYMLVNGHLTNTTNTLDTLVVWKQTVSVQPNTTYYFSAWAMSLNNVGPFAQLKFSVNGVLVGSTAVLGSGVENNSNNGWVRFYGTWTSGPTTTTANIYINDLQNSQGGNDFGLDDISFATLSTFVTLDSDPGADAQTVCVNEPINDIVYHVGNGSAAAPTITGLPAGVTSSFDGDRLIITGSPTTAGTYTYQVTTTGCKPYSVTGTITAQQQQLTINAGSNATQTRCVNTAISNIVYSVNAPVSNVTVKGLPPGVTGLFNSTSRTFTISGTPSEGGIYKDTVITTGTCKADTTYGTITVNSQQVALNSAAGTDNQTKCVNTAIVNITYELKGTATGASISWTPSAPAGISISTPSGYFYITGTPSAAGTYNYTVTTSGTCAPAATATGKIVVNPNATLTLTSAVNSDKQTPCINTTITPITYSIGGSGNSAYISSGSLPAGVTGVYSGGVFTISGTPTVAGNFSYTITATGSCAASSISGTIKVQTQGIALTGGQANAALCKGSTLTNVVYKLSGTATGAALSGTLPAGITGSYDEDNNQFIIIGVPTETGTFNYTVNTTGDCSPPASVSGSITVDAGSIGGIVTSFTSQCIGSSAAFNLAGQNGNVVHWEVSTDDGATWTIVNGTTSTLSLTNITMPTLARALVKSSTCDAVYSAAGSVKMHNYWVGTSNDSWNVAANWSDGQNASTACPIYTIPAGTPYSPKLYSTTTTVRNLNMLAGATLDLNGKTLQVNGAFDGTGKLKGSDKSNLAVNASGNAGIVYFDTAAYYNQLKTLTLNSGSSLKLGDDGVGLHDTLNIAAGNATDGYGTVTVGGSLDANGVLTLKSSQNGTAVVGPSSGIITGNVTVERFMPPKRSWRLLAVPFQKNSSSQTVRDAWQEGVNNYGIDYNTYNKNPKPGYGTHITGNNVSTLGWDFNTTQNPSYKVWNPATNGWNATEPPTISTNISAYDAYYIFVRGSRAVDLSMGTAAPADSTTLRATGTLNETGSNITKTYSGVAANGFLLIGNPYASPVGLLDVIHRSTGILDSVFWVYDPMLAGTENTGAYVTYNKGVITPTGIRFPNAVSATKLQSGQAFMVQMSSGNTNASIEFRQADKIAAQSQVFGLRGDNNKPAAYPTIYTNLLDSGSNGELVDGVGVAFNNRFSAAIDADDANKQWNFGENITLARNGKELAIEMRPMPKKTDTLFYSLYLKQKPYTLQVFAANIDVEALPKAWLVDKYLNKKIAVDLVNGSSYSFVPGSDSNSNRNRFVLVFSNIKNAVPASRVPVTAGEVTLDGSVKLYPNPANTNKVTLQFTDMNKGKYEISVYNISGQKLATRKLQHNGGSNAYTLPLQPSWASGVYTVKIISEDLKKAISLNLVISK